MKQGGQTKASAPESRPEALTAVERDAVERGEADAEAGRTVPHDKVKRWLLSWGKPNELRPAHFTG